MVVPRGSCMNIFLMIIIFSKYEYISCNFHIGHPSLRVHNYFSEKGFTPCKRRGLLVLTLRSGFRSGSMSEDVQVLKVCSLLPLRAIPILARPSFLGGSDGVQVWREPSLLPLRVIPILARPSFLGGSDDVQVWREPSLLPLRVIPILARPSFLGGSEDVQVWREASLLPLRVIPIFVRPSLE